ncbi:sensor histidine kinase [Enterococcus sp. HY326]|uniref:sensor histidine kinase n=1 Tax=Enterococcus sp. HY326 TaxID=2971265 RepID=UPI00223EE7D1|nr:HAMP domain-containing sensor histidine kinase [Enterococcus sp. HY326]
MTIKRKLFISHIVMIVVPVLLSLLVLTGALVFVYEYFWGGYQKASDENYQFREQYAQVEKLVNSWEGEDTGTQQIIEDVEGFYQDYFSTSIALLVYQNSELIDSIGEVPDSNLLAVALNEDGDHTYIVDQLFVASFKTTQYDVILFNTNYTNDLYYENPIWDKDYDIAMSNILILILIAVLLVIYLMNRFLTKRLTNSITQPLEELAFGFQQIKAGELHYQIDYQRNDEFAPIMSDFNQMAQRLELVIKERDQNENSRRELVAGISHDLRTPLTSIEAYLEGLEKGVAATPKMRDKYFATIKRKTKDMEHIINQLFLFSKLDTGEFPFNFEVVNASEFLQEYLQVVKPEYHNRGLQVSLTGPFEERLPIRIDVAQLRSVLTNLLENTLKYSDKQLTINRMSYQRKADDLEIQLLDNGPGVAEDNLPQLFQLFYRSDQARSNPSDGSGLGLAIARKTIEGFGGEISAFLPEEGGFGVIIKVPLFKEDKR